MLHMVKKLFSWNSPKKRKSLRGSRRYHFLEAGESTDLTVHWLSGNQTFDSIIATHLEKIRARARGLSVNDPYYARFMELCGENILGHQGIKLQMRAVKSYDSDGSPVLDYEINNLVENLFKKWGRRETASADGRSDWLTLQELTVSSVVRDGEIFFKKVREKSNPFLFSLQPIEADLVPLSLNKDLPNGRKIRLGIETSKRGKILAYYVATKHPGEGFLSLNAIDRTERIPAHSMIHVFLRKRVTQSRGIPWGVSSLVKKYLLDKYEKAEVVAANVSSSKMGFYKKNPEEDTQIDYDEDAQDPGKKLTYELKAGTIEELPDGWDFQSFDPQHPTTGFGPFMKSMLRSISSGMGIGYNHLSNDYESVNFSSLRASNLVEREHWRQLQSWLIREFYEPVFTEFLKMALLSKQINLPFDGDFEKLNNPVWRPRGWGWVDPVKEMQAHEKSISLGLASVTGILASMGLDYEEILQDRKNEFKLREKYAREAEDKNEDAGA